MVEVVYYVASSLDGYIATSGGSAEWLSRFHTAGEDHGAGELESSVDTLCSVATPTSLRSSSVDGPRRILQHGCSLGATYECFILASRSPDNVLVRSSSC